MSLNFCKIHRKGPVPESLIQCSKFLKDGLISQLTENDLQYLKYHVKTCYLRLFMKFMIGIYRNYSFTSISFWEAFWLFDTKIHFLSYQKVENGLGTRLKFEQSWLFFLFHNNNNLAPKKLNVTNYISVLMLVEWVWH